MVVSATVSAGGCTMTTRTWSKPTSANWARWAYTAWACRERSGTNESRPTWAVALGAAVVDVSEQVARPAAPSSSRTTRTDRTSEWRLGEAADAACANPLRRTSTCNAGGREPRPYFERWTRACQRIMDRVLEDATT